MGTSLTPKPGGWRQLPAKWHLCGVRIPTPHRLHSGWGHSEVTPQLMMRIGMV